jgi:hypothetical protein
MALFLPSTNKFKGKSRQSEEFKLQKEGSWAMEHPLWRKMSAVLQRSSKVVNLLLAFSLECQSLPERLFKNSAFV